MQKESRRWEGLRDAALWVHQRQDVFNAILNQRPTRTDLSICNIDRSMNEASDEIWAKRSTCLTADVVSFCFGAESSSIPKYMALKHQLHLWDTCKPPSFTPLYYRECDAAAERYFPEVWLTLDACGKSSVLVSPFPCLRSLSVANGPHRRNQLSALRISISRCS